MLEIRLVLIFATYIAKCSAGQAENGSVLCEIPSSQNFVFIVDENLEYFECKNYERNEIAPLPKVKCKNGGMSVFKYENKAWHTCINGGSFQVVACEINGRCMDYGKVENLWKKKKLPKIDDPAEYCQEIIQNNRLTAAEIGREFTPCDFKKYKNDEANAPDACLNGINKYVFYRNNTPEHCVLKEHGSAYNNKCISITELLNATTKMVHSEYLRKYDWEKHHTFVYRNLIYKKGDVTAGSTSTLEAAQKLAREFATHEPQTFAKSALGDVSIGPQAFCDMALHFFPITDIEIFRAAFPKECPDIDLSSPCESEDNDEFEKDGRPYPKDFYNVWYDANKVPTKCFFKPSALTTSAAKCVNFATALKMLREKNYLELNVYKTLLLYQRLFLAGQPKKGFYTRFVGSNMQSVLKELVKVLDLAEPGMENIGKSLFGDDIGPVALCTIFGEYIPFSDAELLQNSEEC